MSRIFLSHASAGDREAIALKLWLAEQNPRLANEIFLDLDPDAGIRIGERWAEALRRANARCEAVVCLLSKEPLSYADEGGEMASQRVSYTLDGKVAVLRMDDGKANAISAELIDELDTLLERARTEARAVVIAGRDGRFSGGFDLTVMMASPDSARELVHTGAQFLMSPYLHPQPVVAACTGHALAAGVAPARHQLPYRRRRCVQARSQRGLDRDAATDLRDRDRARPAVAPTLRRRFDAGARLQPQRSGGRRISRPRGRGRRCVQEALSAARKLADLPTGALAETKRLSRQPMIEHVIDTLEEDLATVAPPRTAET